MRKDRSWKRKQGIKVSSRSESDDRIKAWANNRAKTENTSSTYLPKANHASSQSHKDNEEKAYARYLHAGFVVHPRKGWLGASPDGWLQIPLLSLAMESLKSSARTPWLKKQLTKC